MSGLDVDEDGIFAGFFIFAVAPNGRTIAKPRLAFEFPDDPDKKDKLGVKALSSLCFPYDDKCMAALTSQCFTFYFQAIKLYGFCKQNEPATPASDAECLCLVTRDPWHSFYRAMLLWLNGIHLNRRSTVLLPNVLTELAKSRRNQASNFVFDLKTQPQIKEFRMPSGAQVASISQTLSRFDSNPNLVLACESLSTTTILTIFASLLMERRIIIVSGTIGVVTDIIYGISELLYPLAWCHILIPILSRSLIDYCYCPAPFLMGVHTSLVKNVLSGPMEEHVLINADTDTLQTPHDDYQSIPLDLLGPLRAAVNKAKAGQLQDESLSKAFLNFFVVLLRDIPDFIDAKTENISPKNQNLRFNQDKFVASQPQERQTFLKTVMRFQSFHQFLYVQIESFDSNTVDNNIFTAAKDQFGQMSSTGVSAFLMNYPTLVKSSETKSKPSRPKSSFLTRHVATNVRERSNTVAATPHLGVAKPVAPPRRGKKKLETILPRLRLSTSPALSVTSQQSSTQATSDNNNNHNNNHNNNINNSNTTNNNHNNNNTTTNNNNTNTTTTTSPEAPKRIKKRQTPPRLIKTDVSLPTTTTTPPATTKTTPTTKTTTPTTTTLPPTMTVTTTPPTTTTPTTTTPTTTKPTTTTTAMTRLTTTTTKITPTPPPTTTTTPPPTTPSTTTTTATLPTTTTTPSSTTTTTTTTTTTAAAPTTTPLRPTPTTIPTPPTTALTATPTPTTTLAPKTATTTTPLPTTTPPPPTITTPTTTTPTPQPPILTTPTTTTTTTTPRTPPIPSSQYHPH